jgi:hypothetical protein
MSGSKNLKALTAALIVLLLLNSCADFFSTTWGDAFKRDPKKVTVTSSNVYDLLEAAKGDPELSREILEKINARSDDTLKHAAIKAANQAAEISTLALENVRTLIDAASGNLGYETAITNVASAIQKATKGADFIGISDKLVEILSNEMVVPLNISPKTILINTREITATIPKTDGGKDTATVVITVGDDGTGTATITDSYGNPLGIYDCVINDDGTITLEGAGENRRDATIKYDINEENRAITLSDLDAITTIADRGYADSSDPSNTIALGKPLFTDEFLDKDSVSDSDLTLMVISLILAKYDRICDADPTRYPELEDYLRSWEHKNVKTGYNMDPDEILIAATVNGMIDRGELTNDKNELVKMIEDLLKVQVNKP